MTEGGRSRGVPGVKGKVVRYPPERAFVVQISSAEASKKPSSGRVEHVLTGRSTSFDSLEKLSEFIGEVLAIEGRGRESDPTD